MKTSTTNIAAPISSDPLKNVPPIIRTHYPLVEYSYEKTMDNKKHWHEAGTTTFRPAV